MTTEVRWCAHTDGDAMALALALAIRDALLSAIAERGRAIVALAGGKTPWPTYEHLARESVPWDRVIVVPTDDRMVPVESPLSNFGVMSNMFEPLGARVEPLVNITTGSHGATGRAANERLQGLPWPLDLVLLGMGADGHTASIFPGEDYALATERDSPLRALGVLPEPLPPEAPVARVSLSLTAIASARVVAIVATGSVKRAVIEHALAAGDDSAYPIGRVLAAIPAPVRIYWTP